jgi:hypothetical protein
MDNVIPIKDECQALLEKLSAKKYKGLIVIGEQDDSNTFLEVTNMPIGIQCFLRELLSIHIEKTISKMMVKDK